MKKKIPGILLISYSPLNKKDANTINEHVESISKYSNFFTWNINTEVYFPKILLNFDFDVIVLHYSVFDVNYRLPKDFLNYILESKNSYKIAFFQDEHMHCKQRFKFINDFNIDTIYTCLEEQYHDLVYKKYTKASYVKYCIPGYVSADLESIAKKFSLTDSDRTVDFGYRARQLSFYMGKGAQEKHEIGLKFIELCREHNITFKLDIKINEESRLYGDSWYDFLGNCKNVIGVESGVSVYDIEDKVYQEYITMINENPNLEFKEFYDKVLYKWENNIPLRTISPRHFEAAAFRCCQVLFEGDYSGMMLPNVHYIELKKDYSNFLDVVKKINNAEYRKNIIDNAYNDLIISNKYTYKNFVAEFDQHLMSLSFEPNKNFDRKTIDIPLNRNIEFNLKKVKLRFFIGNMLLKIIKDKNKVEKIKIRLKSLFEKFFSFF